MSEVGFIRHGLTWRIYSQGEPYRNWATAYPKFAEMVALMFELLGMEDEAWWDKYSLAYGMIDCGGRAGILTMNEVWDIRESMEVGLYFSR